MDHRKLSHLSVTSDSKDQDESPDFCFLSRVRLTTWPPVSLLLPSWVPGLQQPTPSPVSEIFEAAVSTTRSLLSPPRKLSFHSLLNVTLSWMPFCAPTSSLCVAVYHTEFLCMLFGDLPLSALSLNFRKGRDCPLIIL